MRQHEPSNEVASDFAPDTGDNIRARPVTTSGSGPRVAILGAGLMGRWHAHAARSVGANVVAVADPVRARAVAVAGNNTPVFSDLETMFQDRMPDVLHVCSPSETHVAAIRHAVSCGVHLLVEKPLAASADETREILELAASEGVSLCPVHQYAFQSCVERVLSGLNRCGTPELVEMSFFSAGGANSAEELYPEIAADILPHPVAISQRIWPDIDIETLRWSVLPMGRGGWQLAAPAGAALLRINLSLLARPTQASLSIWGPGGAWEADLFHGFSRFRTGSATRNSKILRPIADAVGLFGMATGNLALRAIRREMAYPGLRDLMAAFYRAIAGSGSMPVPAEKALGVAVLRDTFLAHVAGSGPR